MKLNYKDNFLFNKYQWIISLRISLLFPVFSITFQRIMIVSQKVSMKYCLKGLFSNNNNIVLTSTVYFLKYGNNKKNNLDLFWGQQILQNSLEKLLKINCQI